MEKPSLFCLAALLSFWIAINFSSQSACAQSIEAGGFFGCSNYLGELRESHFEMSEARKTYGAFLRLNVSDHFAIKTHLYKSQISGTDENYLATDIRKRNLSFRTDLLELGLQGELALAVFGSKKRKIASSYIFGGVAGIQFIPKAKYGNEWIDLQPLGTEGQGMEGHSQKYSTYSLAYPMGIGFRIDVTKYANFGFEIGYRKTKTDYLDDVSNQYPDLEALEKTNPMAAALSFREPEFTGEYRNPVGETRGDPSNKDWYMFCGLTFSTYLYKPGFYHGK